MKATPITCERFDELLSGYLEGELAADARARVEGHMASCGRCAGLVADIRAIQREAASLPTLVPSRDLWAGVAERIETPVIRLDERAVAARSRLTTRWLTAAAAGLVIVTAGVTYLATTRLGPEGRAGDPIQSRVATIDSSGARQVDSVPGPADSAARRAPGASPLATDPSVGLTADPGVRGAVGVRPVGRASSTEAVYDREIARLQSVVRERRDELDVKTVIVIERNLRVIEDAIAQSRAALARDPASRIVRDQLTNALDTKLELLRTVALLPSRT